MMVIENRYEIGQAVYLITDKEQEKRIVTAITIRTSALVYELANGIGSSEHYDFELSETEDIEMKVK